MQTKFIWNEKYSVGVPKMDEQHKMFFEIANEVIDVVNDKITNRNKLLSLLDRFVGYSFYHLNFEEYYFDKYRYEDRLSHKDGHSEFREKIQKYKNNCELQDTDLEEAALKLADFATSWLQQHILVVDAKYTEFFNNCPIEEDKFHDFK